MRTTIDIPDEIIRLAKQRAADTRVTFRQVVETALRCYLSGRGADSNYRLKWRTERGRLQPGVDLDARGRVIDLMEGRG